VRLVALVDALLASGRAAQPSDKARVLGESISTALNWGLAAVAVVALLVIVAVVVARRRKIRKKATGAR